MGQQPHKYHISDDGKIYRVNDDGSFTLVGNVVDIEKKPSANPINNMLPNNTLVMKACNFIKVGWWKRNYNWLWVTTLVVFIGCVNSYLQYIWTLYDLISYYNSKEYIGSGVAPYVGISSVSIAILLCYSLSWGLSTTKKTQLKLIQIPLVVCAGSIAYFYQLFGWGFSIYFIAWIVTLCLSLFSRKQA